MLHTTTDTLPLPILGLVSVCSTRSPGCKGHIPVSWVSPTPMGHTITSAVSPEQGLHLAFKNLGLEWSQLHKFHHQDGFVYTLVSGLCGWGLGLSCASHCPLTKISGFTPTQQVRCLGCGPQDRQPVDFTLLSC